ncbi:MAG: hypothetical protein KTR16_04175 [Acidiferrobacterales bacterium]|nr:hypothetical protein [Acidiferrobacterales bacterium]
MSKKNKPKKASTSPVSAPKLKPRNPLSFNPLMKKSHAHTKSAKAERAKNKQALKKEVQQQDHD